MAKTKSGEKVALSSYPRSGNTWLRYMIELATGRLSGSVYNDEILPRDDHGVVIKTHLHLSNSFDRGIHLVRNPFDVIASLYRWQNNFLHEDRQLDWHNHFEGALTGWVRHARKCIRSDIPAHRVRYEDMLVDTNGELGSVLDWLGYDVSDADIDKAVKEAEFDTMKEKLGKGKQFFGKGTMGYGILKMSPDEVDKVYDRCGDLLETLGY